MPIYSYKCADCGRIFELLVLSQSDAEEPRCAHCDSLKIKRLLSRPGLIKSSGREDGLLHPVSGQQAAEGVSRMYDQTGIDPGAGFSEVAKRVSAGDSPQELKEAIKDAKRKEAGTRLSRT